MINYDEALSYGLVGDAVFILGSGFSIGAKDSTGAPLKTGSDLAKYLCKETNIDGLSLDMAAQEYIDKYGEKRSIELLKSLYKIGDYESYYKSIGRIAGAHIYTTNYDNLIEKIYNDDKNTIKSYNVFSNLKKANKNRFVLHINGFIEELTDHLDESFRLTYQDYDKTIDLFNNL
jgi:hypothetical protein